jgi:AcrR family transcriptional regulator
MSADNEARNAEIIRRRRAGETPTDIAAAMGLTKSIVLGVTHGAGLEQPGMTPEDQDLILGAAVTEALIHGWANFRREHVAQRARCAGGSVSHAFGGMDALRSAVMRKAVETGTLTLIVQGITAGDPIALSAPVELREAAISTLTTAS